MFGSWTTAGSSRGVRRTGASAPGEAVTTPQARVVNRQPHRIRVIWAALRTRVDPGDVMSTTTSLAAVRAQLSAIVGSVHDTHERVVITRNGEPAAVLISPDDLGALEETLEILPNPVLMAGLVEARTEIEAGTTVENPQRVGKRLLRDLAGYWSARRGQYRVIYVIDDDEVVVTVVNVDHRRDVYRSPGWGLRTGLRSPRRAEAGGGRGSTWWSRRGRRARQRSPRRLRRRR